MKKKIMIVAGTRPNFIKITCFKKENELMGNPFDICLVHTGQHYDDKMANVFFEQFNLIPDFFLNIPAESPITQMAQIMIRLEKVLQSEQPDLVLVPGDVNSTFAAALTCNKTGIRLGHIESGLRSFDRTMPEEFNRILTDDVADYFFVTEPSGMHHLLREGKPSDRIFFTGNTMIDSMIAFKDKIEASDILNRLHLENHDYVLMTMHRPATVDHAEGLTHLLELIKAITHRLTVVFPIHPRTVQNLKNFNLYDRFQYLDNLLLTEPQDYFAFQKLIAHCRFVITDSGGIQEETTFLGIPCLTLRANTERPITIDIGTNELISFDVEAVTRKMEEILDGRYKKGKVPELWDGKATKRILECCLSVLN
jgi:UDP-N-acetylglucosamine 2-epimerase (non-hydrolysing)